MRSNNNNKDQPDYQIPILIDDTVQCMRFFPSKNINYFASGGWDSKLRIFEVKYDITGPSGNNNIVNIISNQINLCQHSSPILTLSWFGQQGALFSGCFDGSINYIDCQKNILTKIGDHKYGCREVIFLDKFNLLLSGGYDGILKLWDIRDNKGPITSFQFNNKVYTMSYAKNLLIVGLSENILSYFNLGNLQRSKFQPELIYNSHIKDQIKKVAALKDGDGYAEGNSTGRIAVKYIDFNNPKFDYEINELKTERDFSFRCYRELKDNVVYSYHVNDIAVNPEYGTICTAEGDGHYRIWDLDKRARVYDRKNFIDRTPLTACEYNLKGDLLAYASGYDWSKGAQVAHLYSRPKIFLHYLQPAQRKKQNV